MFFRGENKRSAGAKPAGHSFLKTSISLISILTFSLAACSKSKSNADNAQYILTPKTDNIVILSTYPNHEDRDIPLDPVLNITFDRRVDAYSAIPENFELMTADGNRVGAYKLVSTKFVPHPNDPSQTVSQIRIDLRQETLFPDMRYIFMWGEPGERREGVDPDAYGVQDLFGNRLEGGAISFTTGNHYSGLYGTADFDLVTATPGRILSRSKIFKFDSKLSELIDRGRTNSFVTFAKNTPIRMTFSKPLGWIPGVDPVSGPRPEISPTPISEFPYMMVGLFDSQTAYDQMYASILNMDEAAWTSFRSTYAQRLKGKVRSTNGRRTLVFELDRNCADHTKCEYPNTTAQVVVAVVYGPRANVTQEQLADNFAMIGFVHFSGIEFESPLNFLFKNTSFGE